MDLSPTSVESLFNNNMKYVCIIISDGRHSQATVPLNTTNML